MIPVPGRKVYENSSFDLREARNARKFASVLQANPRKLMNLDVYLCFSLSLSLEISRWTKAKYFTEVVAKEISLNALITSEIHT